MQRTPPAKGCLDHTCSARVMLETLLPRLLRALLRCADALEMDAVHARELMLGDALDQHAVQALRINLERVNRQLRRQKLPRESKRKRPQQRRLQKSKKSRR